MDINHYLGRVLPAAETLAGLAFVALARGARPQAREHVEALLSVRAEHPHAGLDEPFDSYLVCYRVPAASNDPRAALVLPTAQQRLLAYARQIADPALRQSFLERVPTHRELRATDRIA